MVVRYQGGTTPVTRSWSGAPLHPPAHPVGHLHNKVTCVVGNGVVSTRKPSLPSWTARTGAASTPRPIESRSGPTSSCPTKILECRRAKECPDRDHGPGHRPGVRRQVGRRGIRVVDLAHHHLAEWWTCCATGGAGHRSWRPGEPNTARPWTSTPALERLRRGWDR